MARAVAREISEAADGAFGNYREGEKADEPAITDMILGAIGEHIRSRRFGGVTWNAHILTSSGQSAEEKRYGADFRGVLDIDIPDYSVKKGFLIQAKKAEPYNPLREDRWKVLISQCEKMVKCTPASFVFAYSRKKGIRVIPEVSVLGSMSRDVFGLYNYGVQNFFENHIKCFIGDCRLGFLDMEKLDVPFERALHLTAKMSE